MGYYTEHTLEAFEFDGKTVGRQIELGPGLEKDILNKEKFNFVGYAIDGHGKCYGAVKWYDHAESMKMLSNAFPKMLFMLEGHGEEEDDFWQEWWNKGKFQHCKGKMAITYEKFNPILLSAKK